MKSKLSKLDATEWLGIGFFTEGLLYILSWLIPSQLKEEISALIFSSYLGFIGISLFSIALILLIGFYVGHIKSKKI